MEEKDFYFNYLSGEAHSISHIKNELFSYNLPLRHFNKYIYALICGDYYTFCNEMSLQGYLDGGWVLLFEREVD